MKKVKYLMTKIVTGLLNIIYRHKMYLPTKNVYTKNTPTTQKSVESLRLTKS